MSSRGASGAKPPINLGARRRHNFGISSIDGTESDDDEEGGTSLSRFVAPPQLRDDTGARASGYLGHSNGNPIEVVNNAQVALINSGSRRKVVPKNNSIMDWLLGRHALLTDEDSTGDTAPREHDQSHGAVDDYIDIGDVQDICPACSTSYCQAVDSIPFRSSLKLAYNDPVSHEWLIGNKFILHEAVDERPEDDYVPLIEASRAIQVLSPNVPIPRVRAGWKEDGKVITIIDRVPGERLYDIWWDLSDKERNDLAQHVAITYN
ncbi:hypothetical protein F4808DRAFT_77773 [Astrocystis sublimbata]|nr:hypothetical protein F4808DRAFT_77736 [Astrocystis sublimbata]KAI0187488.1 hypothetical protein F4808DRAFT_77773 [Astrocystis sublimbata]